MTNHAEDIVLLSLTDTDRLETLVNIGLPTQIVPTEIARPIIDWAVEQFFRSNRTVAPSREALLQTWGQSLEDAEIVLLADDEDADTTEWAIEELKNQFTHWSFEQFVRTKSIDMASALGPDRTKVLLEASNALFTLAEDMRPKHRQASVLEGLERSLQQYEGREHEDHAVRGLRIGISEIDDHLGGIRPGELAVTAGGPKTGKSFFAGWAAKCAWERDEVTVVYTLENSVEMFYDRLVCMTLAIDAHRYSRGLCEPEEVERIRHFVNDVMPERSDRLHVIMPDVGDRTMSSMVRRAQMLGARNVVIDQLTFVEHPNVGRKGRPEVIRDLMHELKNAIASGNEPLSAMLMHQINRDGMSQARKTGRLEMDFLAEGSEVERTADLVLGLYQSQDQRIAGTAYLQMLASRREDVRHWSIAWQPSRGIVAHISEANLEAA